MTDTQTFLGIVFCSLLMSYFVGYTINGILSVFKPLR